MTQHKKQPLKIQKKRKKRKRRSKVLLGLLLATLFILLILGAIVLWAFTSTSRPSGKAAEIKDLIINVVEKDVRTVKNTATEENHKTNGLAICMYHYVYDKDKALIQNLQHNIVEPIAYNTAIVPNGADTGNPKKH